MAIRILLAVAFPLSALEWGRRLRPRGALDVLCAAWVALVAAIVVSADLLSAFGLVGSTSAWITCGVVACAVPWLSGAPRTSLRPIVTRTLTTCRDELAGEPPSLALRLMAWTVALLGVANVIVIACTAPGTTDVLAYHLPKMAFAIQSGSFAVPYANYWAQQIHPHNGTALLVYAWQATGGHDQWLSIWQFASYWVATAAVAGLAREAGATRAGALFAGLTFALLTNALTQATTANNDLLLAGHTAVAALAIVRGRTGVGLVLAGIVAGAALGTKASFLIAMPALALLLLRTRPFPFRPAALGLAGLLVLAVPSGYLDNASRWGDPFLGPPEVRTLVTFEGRPRRERVVDGTRNLARYVLDSISADGLPRLVPVVRLHSAVRAPLRMAAEAAGLDLESPRGTRASFRYDRLMSAHEAHAFWGLLGPLLLWPAAIFGLTRPGLPRLLAIAGLLMFPLQAYAALYDPWRGRFFLSTAVFLVPLVALFVEDRRFRRYAHVVAVLGCASAMTAVLLRSTTPLVGTRYHGVTHPSILSLDRVAQMTRENHAWDPLLRTYERIVPPNASVRLTLRPGRPEYVFFGPGLTRRVTPRAPGAAMDPQAWLVLDNSVERPSPGDVALGDGVWLRAPSAQR